MPSPASERAFAARIILAVRTERKTTDQLLHGATVSPLCQEFIFGTLRHYFSLHAAVDRHLPQAPRTKDYDILCLLLVGAYQLHHMRIPRHAAIHETVAACRHLRKPWAKGVLNAVLRKIAAERHQPPLSAGPAEFSGEGLVEAERTFELPAWMVTRLHAAYPDNATAIMTGCLRRAPMSLRVNRLQTPVEDYRSALDSAGLGHYAGWFDENVILVQPVPMAQLPGFANGQVAVQDPGALFAAQLLSAATSGRRPGTGLDSAATPRLLDACAAPGGKLFHLHERRPDIQLVGLELNSRRCEHLRAEARRLQHESVRIVEGDAASLAWWSGDLFDAILLDAPCSGSGTLRRHPDIKLLRQESDLLNYAVMQHGLLANLWRTLRPGGTLLYCTCSLFVEENDAVVGGFVEKQEDALIQTIKLPIGQRTAHGWQLLPLSAEPDARTPTDKESNTTTESRQSAPDRTVDGFYYALLEKRGT